MKSIVLNFAPSFLNGLVMAFDFGATMSVYDSSLLPQEADKLSLALDWDAVLENLNGTVRAELDKYKAMKRVGKAP